MRLAHLATARHQRDEKYFRRDVEKHSTDYRLRPWAERLGVSIEGLRRVGSLAYHENGDDRGGSLVSMAEHWCDETGYTSGGFAIRFENYFLLL